MYMTSSLVAVLALLGVTEGFIVITGGNCPNIPVVPNFDLNRYLGTWYSYENFPAPFQWGTTCVTAKYSLIDSRTVEVLNSGFREYKFFGIVFGREPTDARGTATLVDPNGGGGLKVQFGGQPEFGNSDDANYLIVSTDYTQHSVVYSCSPLIPGFLKVEIAWILTREQGVRPSNLMELRNILSSYGVNTRYFEKIDHSNCD